MLSHLISLTDNFNTLYATRQYDRIVACKASLVEAWDLFSDQCGEYVVNVEYEGYLQSLILLYGDVGKYTFLQIIFEYLSSRERY